MSPSRSPRIQLVIAVLSILVPAGIAESFDYCIIGAGPAGLQLGHFMFLRGWDYVTLERHASAGSFFDVYPRHRQLISLNKRFTGRTSKEFNLRHDWNSLLETNITPMTNRSKDRFPQASVLAEYLRDFAKQQDAASRIRYNTSVQEIARHSGGGFLLTVRSGNLPVQQLSCGKVVHAGGNWQQNLPANLAAQGFDKSRISTYGDLPQEGYEKYEGKRVIIFGLGNAAFETADALAPHVAFVHVFPGRGVATFPWMAYETRYVGSLRTIRSQTLDAYLLKSLDGGFNGHVAPATKLIARKCGQGGSQRCLFLFTQEECPPPGCISVSFDPKNYTAAALAQKLVDRGSVVKSDDMTRLTQIQRSPSSKKRKEDLKVVKSKIHPDQRQEIGHLVGPEKMEWEIPDSSHVRLLVNVSHVTDENADEYLPLAQTSPYPLVYDEIIFCLGFKHDTSIYTNDTKPIFQSNMRFPILTEEYESVNVPGLYFAGNLAHGRDFKRAAGGFIHGFRYTTRALVRMFGEQREPREPWPSTEFRDVAGQGLERLAKHVIHRLNEGSAAYQMVHVLGDCMVLRCDAKRKQLDVIYFEEMPLAYFHERFRGWPRITAGFGYYGQKRTLQDSLHSGTMFEGFLWYFEGNCQGPATVKSEPESRELFRLAESFSTQWHESSMLSQMEGFLQGKFKGALEKKTGWLQLPSNEDDGASLAFANAQINQEELNKEFGAAEVDLWLLNLGTEPIMPQRMKPTPAEQEWMDVEGVVAPVPPGQGLKVAAWHLDTWRAVTQSGAVLGTMQVDHARGIVQNFVVDPDGKMQRSSSKPVKIRQQACTMRSGSDARSCPGPGLQRA